MHVCLVATAPTTGEQICTVTFDTYQAIHGKAPVDGSLFGWRELDGLVDEFPTAESEKVLYKDSVSIFDEVRINPCYSWCVHIPYLY